MRLQEIKELASQKDFSYYFINSGMTRHLFEKELGILLYDLEIENIEIVNSDLKKARKRLELDLKNKKSTPIANGYLEHKTLMEITIWS